MGIKVRNPDGELEVENLIELERSIQCGLVELGDEVQLTPDGAWRKVAALEGLHLRRRKEFNHWYVLAAVLVLEAVLMRSFLLMLFTVSSHAIWYETTKRGRRKPMRWW